MSGNTPVGIERRLLELTEHVARARSAHDICERALTCVTQALGMQLASVLLLDDEHRMRFVSWRGLSDEYRAAVEGHSPWPWNETDAKPVLVLDARRDPSLSHLSAALATENIVAIAFVPLRFDDKLLGKFMLYRSEPHVFTEAEIALAQLVGGQIAFALEYRRRLAAEQQARLESDAENARRQQLEEQQELLIQAGQRMSQSLDIGETLQGLARLTVPRFADWCMIHLVSDQGHIEPVEIAHVDPQKVRLAHEAVKRWPTERSAGMGISAVINSGRARLATHITPEQLAYAAKDESHLQLLLKLGLKSAMIVPLDLRTKTIGAMTFVAAESERCYRTEDLAIAQAIAARAAIAIDKARLFSQAQEARKEAETAVQHLDFVLSASEVIASALEPDDGMQRLAEFIVRHMADYCVVYGLSSTNHIQRVGVAHAVESQRFLVEQLIRLAPPALDDAYGAGAVMRSGRPLLAVNITDELLQQTISNPAHLEVVRRLQPRSSILVPLSARGRTVGALALATTTHSDRHYTDADLSLAQELASRAALLVDNARLYAEARAASRARDEMLGVVSHDLRNPLNIVVTACEVLKLRTEGQDAKPVLTIQRAARQMNRLIQDLLDVTLIEGGALSLQPRRLQVSQVVGEVVSLLLPLAESRSVQLTESVPADLELVADAGRLVQALSNIVGNALKFTPEGGQVRVFAEGAESCIRISVQDNGPGIAEEHLPHLFDRFWRADCMNSKGLGLGLAIAKGIADAHGGHFEVNTVLGEGSTFTLVLRANMPLAETDSAASATDRSQ